MHWNFPSNAEVLTDLTNLMFSILTEDKINSFEKLEQSNVGHILITCDMRCFTSPNHSSQFLILSISSACFIFSKNHILTCINQRIRNGYCIFESEMVNKKTLHLTAGLLLFHSNCAAWIFLQSCRIYALLITTGYACLVEEGIFPSCFLNSLIFSIIFSFTKGWNSKTKLLGRDGSPKRSKTSAC